MTTLNSKADIKWGRFPFIRTDNLTLVCTVFPQHTGLFSFRSEFSLDQGINWLRDTVPDAWILIDPPQVNALRLYTLIPTVSGTITEWKNDLPRIRKMGFNAIHLLPITSMDTSESPYAARDLFDIDKSYMDEGSKKNGLLQLEEYIEEARALDLRLCFDIVLNHVGVHSTIALHAPDWIVPDLNQPDGFKRAGYWSSHGWSTWNDLVLINYEHPSDVIRSEIRKYMTEYALFWAKYANDTRGFIRFDNLHSSDPEFVQMLTSQLHSKYPMVGLLAEYFTDENTLLNTVPLWGLNLVLATPWNYRFVPQLRDYLIYIHHISGYMRYFMPITSHDSGAPAEEFATADSTIPRYVAAALMGTGATGITQGVEFGELKKIEFIGRNKKIKFPDKTGFGQFILQVNTILENNAAFQVGNNCHFVDNGHDAIIAVFRPDPDKHKSGFLVLCNFDIQNPQHITVDLSTYLGNEGHFSCTELLSGNTQTYEQTNIFISLQPCSAQVLRFSEGR